MEHEGKLHTKDYVRSIGVADLPPLTHPFDPGYDLATLEGHLEQSCHLMCDLKISMACWLIADETITRRKVLRRSRPAPWGGNRNRRRAF